MKTLFAALTAALMLTGCHGAQPTAPKFAKVPTTLDLRATLNITGPTGYRVLTLTAWNKSDIDHVTLALYKDNGSGYTATGATKTVANAALGTAVTLTNLRFASNYKVVAKAYADAAETNEIDNIASAGSDAACSTTFATPAVVAAIAGDTVNDATLALAIPVRLKDKTFAGQASGGTGVGVTNGGIVNTASPESF